MLCWLGVEREVVEVMVGVKKEEWKRSGGPGLLCIGTDRKGEEVEKEQF